MNTEICSKGQSKRLLKQWTDNEPQLFFDGRLTTHSPFSHQTPVVMAHPSRLRPTVLIWKTQLRYNPNTHLLAMVSRPYLDPGVGSTYSSQHT